MYDYDAEGNLVSRTEGLLQPSTFVYDQLNRQVGIKNPTVLLAPTDQIGIGYDGVGNLTAYAQLISSALDQVFYAYDTADRLVSVGDATGTINVSADDDGRTQSITFPKPPGTAGMKVDYDYTKPGKPEALDVTTHAGSSLVAFDYDYVVSLYGGSFEVESSQLQNRTVTGSLSNLNSDVDYDYNTSGELTGAEAASGTDYTYEYDDVSNVTKEVEGSITTHYGYDRAGQLCWSGPNTGTKLAQTCPSTPSGNTTINQDPTGNSTNTSADPIVYNDRDQVTTIGGTTMTYRDLGNDLRKNTDTTRTVYGPTGITATVTGSTVTFYTRDPQGTILNAHNTAGTQNYVTEYNGSFAALFNPSGTAVGSYKYAPYGATDVAAETGGTTAASNPFRYIGGYQDKTSGGPDGHYKLGARYYDTHGHFTQPDPIIPGGGDYTYTNGDPINQSDPSGMLSIDFGVTACLGLCLGVDFAYDLESGRGSVTPNAGAGVGLATRFGGPNPAVSSSSVGKSGWSSPTISCNAGPFTVSGSGDGTNVSLLWSRSLSLSCSDTAGYTFAW